jgi:hypothetical protein
MTLRQLLAHLGSSSSMDLKQVNKLPKSPRTLLSRNNILTWLNHGKKKLSIVIIAIIAVGLLGVVIVDSVLTAAQVASPAPPPTKGCRTSLAVNASQGRCFQG